MIFQSIIASNVGYTVFLLPVLGVIRPSRVPLTATNIAAFAAIDTLGGLLLGVLIYLLFRKTRMGIYWASGISVSLLWLAYWLPSVGKGIDFLIIALDGIAAFITWIVFIILYRHVRFSKKGRK